jgi:hypothetical protein
VYGRDNRLKVARDEEKYNAEQKVITDKHQAAEREHRHSLMVSRARERHGGRANVLIDVDGRTEFPSLPTAVEHTEDVAALQNHARLTALQTEHPQHAQHDPIAALEGANAPATLPCEPVTVASSIQRPSKRQRRQNQQQASIDDGYELKLGTTRRGKALSLADLARDLQPSESIQQAEEIQHQQRLPGDMTDGQGPGSAAQLAPPPGVGEKDHEAAGDALVPQYWVTHARATAPLQHINLFAAEESAAKNPETEAEKRNEQKRRGELATQTCDPKFDAQFQFAHGLTGRASVPWYAQQAPSLRDTKDAAPVSHEAQLDVWRRQGTAALQASAGAALLDKPDQGGGLLAGVTVVATHNSQRAHGDEDAKGHKQHRKEKRHKRDKHCREGKSSGASKEAEKAALMARLREERLQREEEERRREAAVLRANGQPTSRYNNAYGFGRR